MQIEQAIKDVKFWHHLETGMNVCVDYDGSIGLVSEVFVKTSMNGLNKFPKVKVLMKNGTIREEHPEHLSLLTKQTGLLEIQS